MKTFVYEVTVYLRATLCHHFLQQQQNTDATVMTMWHQLLSLCWCMLKNAYQFKEETCSSYCETLGCVWFL